MTEDTSRGELGYRPPPFPLFEATFVGEAGDPQRWLLEWNGLVDEPATEVTLAARSDGATALVTSSRWSSAGDARWAAVQVLAALRPTPGFDSADALTVHAFDEALWAPASIVVEDSERSAMATSLSGVTALYCTDADAQLAVAHRTPVALRRVRSGDSAYAADPLASHPYASLPPLPPLT